MMYITHNGTIITGVFSGALPDGGIPVSETFPGGTGDPLELFDSRWNLRSKKELVSEGLIPVPKNHIWDDSIGGFRKATEAELVADGRRELGEREIVDGDFVRDMTPEELDERGLLTDEERRTWRQQVIMARLDEIDREAARPVRAILAGTDTPEDTQILTTLENEAVKLRTELAGLPELPPEEEPL